MRIGFFINTPAQIHFMKGIIHDLNQRGNPTRVLVRDHEDTLNLANKVDLDYITNSGFINSKFGRFYSLPRLIFGAKYHFENFDPDILFGFGDYTAYTSNLLGIPGIIFRNSASEGFSSAFETSYLEHLIDAIISPCSSKEALSYKQIKVNAFIEMNYLAPEYFKPDPEIFEYLDITRDEEFAVVRFNSFEAIHDIGKKGFDREKKIELIEKLREELNVFISSESKLPENLRKHELDIPDHKIHDVLYHSKLLITDTQTMTTEAAILGTPVVRSNSFVGDDDMGNFIELEEKYGLIHNIKDADKAIDKACELAERRKLNEEWEGKRKKLLEDKIDMRKFMIWFLENYPESFEKMKNNLDIQYRFK